jgi:hypothetical protein
VARVCRETRSPGGRRRYSWRASPAEQRPKQARLLQGPETAARQAPCATQWRVGRDRRQQTVEAQNGP